MRTAALLVGLLAFPLASEAGSYRFPWPAELDIELTQDCNDSRYGGHIGNNGWAWDFATPDASDFPVVAARGGVLTHVKMSSDKGCEDQSCMDYANYIVIDHGDGTSSVYLHLAQGSLEPSLKCGDEIARGQSLAIASGTGFSSGPHLHFQVNRSRPDQGPSCECGPDGLACPEDFASWASFWSTSAYPSLPVRFDEWESSAVCEDRFLRLPTSQNGSAKASD